MKVKFLLNIILQKLKANNITMLIIKIKTRLVRDDVHKENVLSIIENFLQQQIKASLI